MFVRMVGRAIDDVTNLIGKRETGLLGPFRLERHTGVDFVRR